MRFKPDPEFWPDWNLDVPMLGQWLSSLARRIESVEVLIEPARPVHSRTVINL